MGYILECYFGKALPVEAASVPMKSVDCVSHSIDVGTPLKVRTPRLSRLSTESL